MTPFINGFVKAAAEEEHRQHKLAYGERLTKLLQRKGKLPATSTPTVGTSSFPKQANEDIMAKLLEYARNPNVTAGVGAGIGGLAGYMSGGPDEENPEDDTSLRNAILGALAGGGLSYGVGKGIDNLNTPQTGALPPAPAPAYKGPSAPSAPKLNLGQGGELNFDPSIFSADQSGVNAPPSSLTGHVQRTATPWQKDVLPAIQDAGRAISNVNQW